MSKRKLLSENEDKISKSLYAKLMTIRKPDNQQLIVSLFKDLDTRRKCYKLGDFEFQPYATEYMFPGFFKTLTLAGRTRLIPIERAKQISFIKTLVALARLIGLDENYESMMERLESVSEAKLSSNKLIEIIPEMIYAYTAAKTDTLILKLEYFTGAEVIDILAVNNIEVNTGKPRSKERAKEHASLYLKGITAAQQRESLKKPKPVTAETNI